LTVDDSSDAQQLSLKASLEKITGEFLVQKQVELKLENEDIFHINKYWSGKGLKGHMN